MKPLNARIGMIARDKEGRLMPSSYLSDFYAFANLGNVEKVLDLDKTNGGNYPELVSRGYVVYGGRLDGRLDRLPFPDDFFDAVFGSILPVHVTEPYWGDVVRVLRPGGMAYMRVFASVNGAVNNCLEFSYQKLPEKTNGENVRKIAVKPRQAKRGF